MDADKTFYPRVFKYNFNVHFRHFERYFDVLNMVGRCGISEVWLDCACGSGYGTRLLSDFCSKVIGYDIDTTAVTYAKQHYASRNCLFTDDADTLEENEFDAIISVETIEHVCRKEAKAMLEKMKLWLKNNGRLIMTTPIVPVSNPNPVNPYHCYEYDRDEFLELLTNAGYKCETIKSKQVTFTDDETKEQSIFLCTVK